MKQIKKLLPTLIIIILLTPFHLLSQNFASEGELKKLDTARELDNLTDMEKDIILEINKVRNNPKRYAELYIKPMLSDNNKQQEWMVDVTECIDDLSNDQSKPALQPNAGLIRAAKDLAKDQSETGQTGHRGSDNSTMRSRIERYGSAFNCAENVSYGRFSAIDIVCGWLIDHGIASRGHRKNIMGDYTQIGVSTATHPNYRYMCVVNFTDTE